METTTTAQMRSSTPAPLRVVKNSSMLSLTASSSRRSSGERSGTDGTTTNLAFSNVEVPLTIAKRGHPEAARAVRRAPAFQRLVKPERSFVKLPHTRARDESRVQSTGAGPGWPAFIRSNGQIPRSPQMVHMGDDYLDNPTSLQHSLHYSCGQERFIPPISPSMGVPTILADERRGATSPLVPAILTPILRITPEVQFLDDGCGSFWAAVEVSGQLRRSDGGGVLGPEKGKFLAQQCPVPRLTSTDHLQFGCLRDIEINVSPLNGAQIVELLQETPVPTSLDASSTILMLVNVQLTRKEACRQRNVSQSTISDELIDELEHHLGTASIEYLHVHLEYTHPAFTTVDAEQSIAETGRTGYFLRYGKQYLNTIARIACQHPSSQWSSRQPSPAPNPLFRIAATHWDPERAADAVHRMLNRATINYQNSIPRGLKDGFHPREDPTALRESTTSGDRAAQWRHKVDYWTQSLETSENPSTRTARIAVNNMVPYQTTALCRLNQMREPDPACTPSSTSTMRNPARSNTNMETRSPTTGSFRDGQKDGSTPRLLAPSQIRTFAVSSRAGVWPTTGAGLQENLQENCRNPAKKDPNSPGEKTCLEEFGARPKATKKASTLRKSSAGSRFGGRWPWANWW